MSSGSIVIVLFHNLLTLCQYITVVVVIVAVF